MCSEKNTGPGGSASRWKVEENHRSVLTRIMPRTNCVPYVVCRDKQTTSISTVLRSSKTREEKEILNKCDKNWKSTYRIQVKEYPK